MKIMVHLRYSSQANLVKTYDDDLFLAANYDVAKFNWVMDSAACIHVCQGRSMFKTLTTKGEFGHCKVSDKQKMKIKGVGMFR